MSLSDYQIPYPVERALENVVDAGLVPARLYRSALPLYIAELSAKVLVGEPFDLLDRYVSLAIAECGFRSVSAIAEYLGLTEGIVERICGFLTKIGHVTGSEDALALTEIGLKSASDDTRYTPKEERLQLYFDGFGCRPLPSQFYKRGVRVLSEDEGIAQKWFRLLHHTAAFESRALDDLAARPDRADWNLPDEYHSPVVRSDNRGYLPCYLIRVHAGPGFRTLAFTAADNGSASDPYLEQLLQGQSALERALSAEDNSEADWRREIGKWLSAHGLSFEHVTWESRDVPRLPLPTRHFPLERTPVKANGEFPLRQVGSYVTQGNYLLHLWCTDQVRRREAALSRALEYCDAYRRDEADIGGFLDQISRRLEVDPALTLSDLREYGRRTGHDVIVSR